MPRRPTKGAKPLYLELPEALLAELQAFAGGRGETVKQVVELAVRRHMAYPPPPPAPPPVEPLPDQRRGRRT
jgi:hypothetical protein